MRPAPGAPYVLASTCSRRLEDETSPWPPQCTMLTCRPSVNLGLLGDLDRQLGLSALTDSLQPTSPHTPKGLGLPDLRTHFEMWWTWAQGVGARL